jgi:hypothetical protein
MFQELYQYCPNINHLFFSTNGVGFTDSIISFIKIIDLIVKNNFQLKIQFSYDGFEWTKKSRGINSQIILNNIMKIIEELNKIELQNLKITFQFHNVISKEIFSIFADESNNDDLFDYLKEF